MSHQKGCTLPTAEIEGSVASCVECGELYQAVLFPRDPGHHEESHLKWVRMDQVPEEQRSVDFDEGEADDDGSIPTRVDLVPYPVGQTAPLVLDMGGDQAIVVQPKPDQRDGELALNIVVGGGMPADLVAWVLGQASEAMTKGIRKARLEQAQKINGHDLGGRG